MQWYKRDATAALEGMRCLTLEERGAYNTILDLIYDRDGDLPDDDRFIAGWLGCHTAVWKRIKVHLVALKKITVVDGVITNHRAEKELSTRRVLVESSASSGRVGAKKRWKNNEASMGYPIATKTQIKKEKKEAPPARQAQLELVPKSEPQPKPVTPESELFRRGAEVLGSGCGGLIVKLRKSCDGSIPQARSVIEMASEKNNPREYVSAAIRNREAKNDRLPGGWLPGNAII
jgi:uncharacterized protein YdaU (DUF1376 family)